MVWTGFISLRIVTPYFYLMMEAEPASETLLTRTMEGCLTHVS
jgi:hypothetical protein